MSERDDEVLCPRCGADLLEDGCCPGEDCDYEPAWALDVEER